MRPSGRGASAATPRLTALVAGSVGRLGEELLNQTLANPRYALVHALTRRSIEATTEKLKTHGVTGESLPQVASEYDLPSADDLYGCVGNDVSYFRRDDIYHRLALEQVLPLAHAAASRGVRRAVFLVPMAAAGQMSGNGDYLAHTREAELAGMFQTLVIIRPTAKAEAAEGHMFQRLAAWVVSTLASHMTPARFQPRRAMVLARLALAAIEDRGPGVHVIPIHKVPDELAGPVAGSP